MGIMDLLDAKDTEKGRKIGIIRVKTARIRVKVLRECYFGASRQIFRLIHGKKVI